MGGRGNRSLALNERRDDRADRRPAPHASRRGQDRQAIDSHSSLLSFHGFTLIELLVVISIMALLVAILLPVLGRVRKQARAMVCQANLKQWATALAGYMEDNEGRFACDGRGWDGIWLLRGTFPSADPNRPDDCLFHFQTKDIALCPMAVKPDPEGFYFGAASGFPPVIAEGKGGSTYNAWEMTTPAPAFRASYGFNNWLFYDRYFEPTLEYVSHLDIFALRGRANIPMLLDSGEPCGRPEASSSPQSLRWAGRDWQGMGTFCMNRHDGYDNCLFLDWSVRKVGLKELWTLKWHHTYDTAGPWTQAGGVGPENWPEWMRRFKDY